LQNLYFIFKRKEKMFKKISLLICMAFLPACGSAKNANVNHEPIEVKEGVSEFQFENAELLSTAILLWNENATKKEMDEVSAPLKIYLKLQLQRKLKQRVDVGLNQIEAGLSQISQGLQLKQAKQANLEIEIKELKNRIKSENENQIKDEEKIKELTQKLSDAEKNLATAGAELEGLKQKEKAYAAQRSSLLQKQAALESNLNALVAFIHSQIPMTEALSTPMQLEGVLSKNILKKYCAFFGSAESVKIYKDEKDQILIEINQWDADDGMGPQSYSTQKGDISEVSYQTYGGVLKFKLKTLKGDDYEFTLSRNNYSDSSLLSFYGSVYNQNLKRKGRANLLQLR